VGDDLRAVLAEIQAGTREGRAWRQRAEQRLDQAAESLHHLSQSLAEVTTEMKLHLHYGQERVERLEERVSALEDIGPPKAPKTAMAVGGGGFFGWLAGGGWDHLTHLMKRILP
jgi:cob(I)alamin adenosyltransferase